MKYTILKDIKEQKGITLVMSLLVLSLIMASVVGLSRVILGEVRISINTKNSLTAFYAADSAIEKALYYVKYSRENLSDASLNNLKDTTFSIGTGGESFTFVEISTTTPGFIFYDTTTSTPAHVDIVNTDGSLPAFINWDPLVSQRIHEYELDWSIDDCFPNHASSKLEITTYSFDRSSFDDTPFDVDIDKDVEICDCTYINNNQCDTVVKVIYNDSFYRFSFRPLDSTVASIDFKIYSGPWLMDLADVVSNTRIVADGTYKNAKYRLNVEIPSVPTVASLFSYVIFSEEVLKKE